MDHVKNDFVNFFCHLIKCKTESEKRNHYKIVYEDWSLQGCYINYMIFYNEERPHSIMQHRTPNKFKTKYYDKLRLLQDLNAGNNRLNQ